LIEADMTNPAGEASGEVLRVDFDRRLMLQFRGSLITSGAELLAYRELDDALGLTAMAGEMLADARTGKDGRHALVGLLRQSVFGRLAGYEDVSDAQRTHHDSAMRWILGGKAATVARPRRARWAASRRTGSPPTRTYWRWSICPANGSTGFRSASAQGIILDMDSGVNPTHGEEENSVWNGHYGCTCYRPLFLFNHFGSYAGIWVMTA
jgi:hypothetical protein